MCRLQRGGGNLVRRRQAAEHCQRVCLAVHVRHEHVVLAGLARHREPALKPAQRIGEALDEQSGMAEGKGGLDQLGQSLVVAAVELRSGLVDQRRGGVKPTEGAFAKGQERARPPRA